LNVGQSRARLALRGDHPNQACFAYSRVYLSRMKSTYTAIVKQRGEWWIGWIEEVPGVNAQERTKEELMVSLRDVLKEALEFNRDEARKAAESDFFEELLVV